MSTNAPNVVIPSKARNLLFPGCPLLLLAVAASLLSSCSLQQPCRQACVVFIGDSIISKWPAPQPPGQISGLQIINRGVPGDTTSHMLSRFDHDVLQFRPNVVVILGGINDLTKIPLSITEQNLSAMTRTAQEHKIRVVLATLPPAHKPSGDATTPKLADEDQLSILNSWLKSFSEQNHFALADFYATLAGERGSYQPGLSYDGVHPTAAGYQRMEPLLRQAIQNAVSKAN